jgi:SAM-dependent methyltransferase
MTDDFAVNRAHWDERAPAHAASPDYAVGKFVDDPDFISDVVRFDLPRLGDIRGLKGVHLQCHIGTDTVSLARLGATMTGLDFSPPALIEARKLASALNLDVDFVESDLYGAPDVLPNGVYDLVFTGIGALCWLPDIRRWADVVARLLKPGGRLFVREGHPVLWSLADDRADGLLVIAEAYFETVEPIISDIPGSYVQVEGELTATESRSWNHGLGEIVTALLDVGMTLTMLVEHDSVPWRALDSGLEMTALKEWRLADRPKRLPQSYTLQAVKQ